METLFVRSNTQVQRVPRVRRTYGGLFWDLVGSYTHMLSSTVSGALMMTHSTRGFQQASILPQQHSSSVEIMRIDTLPAETAGT